MENDQLMELIRLNVFKEYFKLQTKVSDNVKEAILYTHQDVEFNSLILESFIDYATDSKKEGRLIEIVKKNQTVEAVYNNQNLLVFGLNW